MRENTDQNNSEYEHFSHSEDAHVTSKEWMLQWVSNECILQQVISAVINNSTTTNSWICN